MASRVWRIACDGEAVVVDAAVGKRVDQRTRALSPTLTESEGADALSVIEREETERGTRRAVAGFDYTFSVPKSVSIVWGVSDSGTQAPIAQAHHDTITDVITWMETHVLATRTGSGGRDGAVVQEPVTGVVATAFDHYDSRTGDPLLHTHVVVANRVCTVSDGKWRTVDSRPMHQATVTMSALYNGLLAGPVHTLTDQGQVRRVLLHRHHPDPQQRRLNRRLRAGERLQHHPMPGCHQGH